MVNAFLVSDRSRGDGSRRRANLWLGVACAAALAFAAFHTQVMAAPSATPAVASAATSPDAELIERGRYLATAADCMACHTAKGGQPFAGGYAIQTPIGAVYSSNITPSRSAGIGSYSEAEFAAAVKRGVRADGAHLYPAMPYTSYAKLSDGDVSAMYAYFMKGVKAVDTVPVHQTALGFPFNIRTSMAVWNMLFLDTKPFEPDPAQSPEYNRGMYLAESLAHCATCHTPRNALMAERGELALSGASIGSWYAPNITSDKLAGIGGWSREELYRYLKTGAVAGKAQAAGPMAEAIENSLQHLSDADLNAIVTYISASKPVAAAGLSQPRYAYGKPSDSEVKSRGDAQADAGWKVFSAACAACHQTKGTGLANGDYPSLYNNTATGAERADNLVATILFGLERSTGHTTRFMPGFGPQASFTERLSDEEIAQVSNYVLKQYGNPDVTVTRQFVATIREGGPKPLIARLAPAAPILIFIVIVLIALVVVTRRRRRAARATQL